MHVVPLGAALAPATTAVAANEKQTKCVSFLVSATKSEAVLFVAEKSEDAFI